jgi:hypothetical protein
MHARWWPWEHCNLRGDPTCSNAAVRGGGVFNRRAPFRQLICLIDSELIHVAASDPIAQYVLELVTSDRIEAHLYADGGPPAHASRVWDSYPHGQNAVKDWIEVRRTERDDRFVISLVRHGRPVELVALKDLFSFRRVMEAPLPREYKTPLDPEARRHADAIASLSADAIRADLFVTNRSLLHKLGRDPESTVTVMHPSDAVPVIGLYLRQQGTFLVNGTPSLAHPNRVPTIAQPTRSEFYWHAAELLLPEAWSWNGFFRRCSLPLRNDLDLLRRALLWRMNQALQARDRLLAACSVPQDPDSMDEVPTELDHLLLWIMAMLDILARITHIVLDLAPANVRAAGWQNELWLNDVAAHDPSLAALFKGNTNGKRLLNIAANLRNSIHGAALSGDVSLPIVGAEAGVTLVRLPTDGQNKVIQATNGLGGPTVWGITRPFGSKSDLHIRPCQFVEQLLPLTVKVLNQLMAAIPVELLPGRTASPAPPRVRLPVTPADQRTLWQLGIAD